MERRYRSVRLIASSKETQTKIFQVGTDKGQLRCLKRQSFSSAEERNCAYLLQSLQKVLVHPGILKVFRSFAGEDDAGFFLETELEWGGVDLEEITGLKAKRKTPWTVPECTTALGSMISALAFAQRLGICHRDVKPMNIFQTESGSYKLGDFGCAKSAEDLHSSHSIAGTPMFLSPTLRLAYSGQIAGVEEKDRVEHDPYKSDVYSLGLTGLYLLKGRMMEYFGRPEEVTREVKKLETEEWLRTVLQAMLEVQEVRRPNFLTLEELWTRLRAPAVQPSSDLALQPKKPSRLKRVSLYENRNCLSCSTFFLFNPDDMWRRTTLATEASNFCSEHCWTLQSRLDVPIDMRCRECGLADEALYFLHCGVHFVCISHHNIKENVRQQPLMRQVCPDCPLPQISSLQVRGLTFYTTADCPAQFLRVSQKDSVVYLFISREIVDILGNAKCHFCMGELQEEEWRYLSHNELAAFICSKDCFFGNVVRSQEQSFCQECQVAIPAKRAEVLHTLETSFNWTSEDLCSFCRLRPASIHFMCNQSLCYPCLQATYRSKQMFFFCPCCGLAILQADYFDLLREIKVI